MNQQAEITINRSADDVWAAIGDFGDLSWHPRVESATLDGDRRTTKNRGSDLTTVERLISRDDARRSFHYGTVGVIGDSLTRLPDGGTFDVAVLVDRHFATLTVLPVDDSSSHIVYEVVVEGDEETTTMIRGGYQVVLEILKAQLES